MNKKQIILIGAGGHCKSCIDVLESENKFEIIFEGYTNFGELVYIKENITVN